MKVAAKERRQRMIEEERERKKEAKVLEAVAKKAELEEKKIERVYKKLEEKVRWCLKAAAYDTNRTKP